MPCSCVIPRRLLAFVFLFASADAAVAATVWRDTFDPAATLPWSSLRGNWAVADGAFAAQVPGNLPPTAALLPYELADFSLEVDVIEPADGGLWVRTNADASAGVMLVVFPTHLYWHVILDPVSGPWTVHGLATISPPLGSGASRIRVTGNGPLLRAYVNGAPVAASTLDLSALSLPPGSDFLRGRVGLYDNSAPGTKFDNLRLESGTPVEVVAVGDADNRAVRLFPVAANGDVAPIATLAGPNTGLIDVRGVVLDSDTLYVASGSGHYVRAFSMTRLGDVAPLRTINGPATGLGAVYGIAKIGPNLAASSDTGPVSVFDAMATGDVAPLRTIDTMVGAYAVDASAGELFAAGHFQQPSSVFAYADTASGNTLPLRHLTGASTGLGTTNLGLASTADTLFVCQYIEARIRAYPRNADGDTPPLRTIAGPMTGLGAPVDIAVRGDELFVANTGYGNVLVFPAQGTGDIAPTRVIGGPATGFTAPFALDFGIYVIPDDVFIDGFE